MDCALCFENKIIKYHIDEDKDFIYCYNCVLYLKDNQWYNYIKDLKTDCQASLKRSIEIGPPVNVRDFAVENGKEIDYFIDNNKMISAKLKNSFDVEKRDAFWTDLKQFDVNFVLKKYDLD